MIDHLDNTKTLRTIEEACNQKTLQLTSLRVIEANTHYKSVRCTFYKCWTFKEFQLRLLTAFPENISVRTVEDWQEGFAALLSINLEQPEAEVI